MAVPKRRTSKSRQGHRRSHHYVTAVQVQYCPKCNEPVMPHRLCPNCGSYQGREVVNMEAAEQGK
jgi:large subunit ribosomal protein L32